MNYFTKLDVPVLTQVTIGDWSKDGHKQSDRILYLVNYQVSNLRQAYKDSCKRVGVQFNHNENYMNPADGNVYDQILTDYGNNQIREEETLVLFAYGVLTDEYLKERGLKEPGGVIEVTDPEDVADIIMRFISLSMPDDFTYQRVDLEPLNGWGNKELKCQFGYGIYD